MTIPLTKTEQLQTAHFKADRRLFVAITCSNYNKVWQKNNIGDLEQDAFTFPQIKHDSKILQDSLKRYQFTNQDDIYLLEEGPTFADVNEVFAKLSAKLEYGLNAEPQINYLIIFLFAGQGVRMLGNHWLILNQLDPYSQYYAMFNAEGKIREIAKTFQNSYTVGLFSCFRQLQETENMKGMAMLQQKNAKILEKTPGDKIGEQTQSVFETKQFADEGVSETMNDPNINTLTAKYENSVFLFSNRPILKYETNPTMIQHIAYILRTNYDRQTFTITIPRILLDLKYNDRNLELIRSGTLQPVKLSYHQNLVTRSKAIIFVNTRCKSKCDTMSSEEREIELVRQMFQDKDSYKDSYGNDDARTILSERVNAEERKELERVHLPGVIYYRHAVERAQTAKKLFKDVLQFQEVLVYTDLTKAQVIMELDRIQNEAVRFE